jgi:NAD(P)H-flavin reductase
MDQKPQLISLSSHNAASLKSCFILLRIIRKSKQQLEATDYHQVILSGPHGKTYQFGEYDQILLFAEGVGIAALLQFLNELTHKLHRGLFRTRRVSVFWQLQQLGKCSP